MEEGEMSYLDTAKAIRARQVGAKCEKQRKGGERSERSEESPPEPAAEPLGSHPELPGPTGATWVNPDRSVGPEPPDGPTPIGGREPGWAEGWRSAVAARGAWAERAAILEFEAG